MGSYIEKRVTTFDHHNSVEYAAGVMMSQLSSNLYQLSDKLFAYEETDLRTYCFISRSVIETTADIHHVFSDTPKIEERLEKFSVAYIASTNDLVALATATDFENLNQSWRKNNWTNKSYDQRISDNLGSKNLAVYGYSSRLLHGLNRDNQFINPSNSLLIRLYLFHKAVDISLETLLLLGEPWLAEVFVIKIKEYRNQVNALWKNRNVSSDLILRITTFFDEGRSKLEQEYVDQYRESLAKSFSEKKQLPEYQLMDHSDSDKHYKQAHSFLS